MSDRTRGFAVHFRDLISVAVRGLLIQATFNTEGRQGLGVAVAMSTVARRIQDPEKRRRFLRRHLEGFNTNPVMAGPLLGAVVRLEEQDSGEHVEAPRAARMKSALESPLAAVGDALMWNALRPAALLWATLAFIAVDAGAFVGVLLLYNLVHLGLRVGGFFWGYRSPDRIQELLRARWIRLMTALGSLMIGAGVFAIGYVSWGFRAEGPAALGLVGLIAGWILGRRGFTRGAILAAGGMIVGLVFAALA